MSGDAEKEQLPEGCGDNDAVQPFGTSNGASLSSNEPARVLANRRNAVRSTGPKTAAGRARASKNSTKHGLLSRGGLLEDESQAEFASFAGSMRRALLPVGGLEGALVERVVASAWRLRRFERIEAMMLDGGRKNWLGEEVGLSSGFIGLCVNGDAFSKLGRYEAGIERALFRAMHELQRLQAARTGLFVSPPIAVEVQVTSASS